MRNLLGIIDLSEHAESLGELAAHRTLGAVPFGGRYRIIDFTLSNMVNAGIRNVGILLNDRFGPLLDHIKDGKEWDLNRQRDGMFLLPAPLRTDSGEGISSNLINLRHNIGYLEKSRQEYALFSGCGMVTNIDYQAVLAFHLEKKADITVIYSQMHNLQEDSPYTALVVDEGGRVTDMALNPRHCKAQVSLNMYVQKGPP